MANIIWNVAGLTSLLAMFLRVDLDDWFVSDDEYDVGFGDAPWSSDVLVSPSRHRRARTFSAFFSTSSTETSTCTCLGDSFHFKISTFCRNARNFSSFVNGCSSRYNSYISRSISSDSLSSGSSCSSFSSSSGISSCSFNLLLRVFGAGKLKLCKKLT